MEILLVLFLGLFGITAIVSLIIGIVVLALYPTVNLSKILLNKFAQRKPYVNRMIDLICVFITLSTTSLLHFIVGINLNLAYGIGFLLSLPIIVYWYFWRPHFLNKPLDFL